MAGALKLKISISGVAIFVLTLLPLIENKFFAPVTIKRWSRLTIDDFQGIPQPLSSFAAAISSSIYLEYDTAVGKYFAYAGQSNIRSWAKRREDGRYNYLLDHEQCHFNITEYYARKLNKYIEQNPNGSLGLFQLRLASLEIDVRTQQRKFDRETHHGTIFNKQRRWEYKMDSLLTSDSGYVTDTISGAQAYFPYTPEYEEKFENNISYRSWTLKKYAMEFTLQSFEAGDQNLTKLAKSLTEYVKNDRVTIRSVSTDTSKNTLKSFFILDDSSGYTYYTKWIYSRKNLYCINSRYPISSNETTGYAENALSFLNSFSIADTSDH